MIAPRRRAASVTWCPILTSGGCSHSSIPTMKPRWRTSATPGRTATRCSSRPLQQLDLWLQALQRLLALERLERRDPGGARERVARIGMAVKERPGSLGLAEEARVDALIGERRRERQIAAREALADAQQVGRDPFVLAGEHGAGTAEAGRDLVADQEHAVGVAALAHGARDSRRAASASPPLLVQAVRRSPRQPPRDARSAAAPDGPHRPFAPCQASNSRGPVERVEQVDSAHRDRADRVAVVGVLQADEAPSPRLAPLGRTTGMPSSARSRPPSSRCPNRTRE